MSEKYVTESFVSSFPFYNIINYLFIGIFLVAGLYMLPDFKCLYLNYVFEINRPPTTISVYVFLIPVFYIIGFLIFNTGWIVFWIFELIIDVLEFVLPTLSCIVKCIIAVLMCCLYKIKGVSKVVEWLSRQAKLFKDYLLKIKCIYELVDCLCILLKMKYIYKPMNFFARLKRWDDFKIVEASRTFPVLLIYVREQEFCRSLFVVLTFFSIVYFCNNNILCWIIPLTFALIFCLSSYRLIYKINKFLDRETEERLSKLHY